jgi:integrase
MSASEYLEWYAATGRAASSIAGAKQHVTAFETWRDGRPLTPGLLLDYHAWLGRKRTIQPSYKNVIQSHVRGYLMHLIHRRNAGELVAPDVTLILRTFDVERTVPRILTRAEVARLVAHADAFTLVALLTGARRKEVESVAVIESELLIKGTKTRTERLMPLRLMGCAVPLFRQLPPLECTRARWKEITTAAGLEGLTVKALRSTASSYFKCSKVLTDWEVDKLLGHSAAVADRHYDRYIDGVSGDTIPEWYGCPDLFEKTVERLAG